MESAVAEAEPAERQSAEEEAASGESGEASLPFDGEMYDIILDEEYPLGTDVWVHSSEGGTLMVHTKTGPPDFLDQVDVPTGAELSFIEVDVDNREGVDAINMYEIVILDPEGNKTTYETWSEPLSEWDADVDLINDNQVWIEPGERDTVPMVAMSKAPGTVKRLNAYPRGAFELVEGVPVKRAG